jgi:hypothetical protein
MIFSHRAAQIPLLGKGGVAAPSKKWPEGTLIGADGVVRSREHRQSDLLINTTPSALFGQYE